MRLPLLIRCAVFLFVGWWGCTLPAQASHIMGADLTYQYIGTPASPNLYRVTVHLFQETGLVFANSVQLTCGKNGCGATSPGSFTNTLQLVSTVLRSTGCPTGPNFSFRVTTLQGNVQLPPARWTLSIAADNRRAGVVNIPRSDEQNLYTAAEIDNSSGLVNSSPRFTTLRLFQLISTQAPQRQSLSAFDEEADSLAYRLVQPMGVIMPGLTCAANVPVGTASPHFQVNPVTGELLAVAGPAQQGYYALTVRVDEYRRLNGSWQPIGSIMRDMLYLVAPSTNQPPAFTRVALSTAPGVQLLGQPISVSSGQAVLLNLTATDPDAGQQLTLFSDLDSTVPGAAFQDLGNGQGQLTWQVPATLPSGRYYLPVAAADNACPTQGTDVLTLPFRVTQQALATAQGRQPLAQPPFPAPFQDEVRFQLASSRPQVVVIADALGRTVAQLHTAPDGSLVWRPAASVCAGLYFARTPDGRQVARLSYSGH